ncbi:MAG: HAD family hydrolase [Defluviitaleaceae bacterium]|nr:HAD family hydrolase [Defluviitaleaceae bacterium]
MLDVRLIATDLDGTFFKDDKTVSDYTRRVFLACREKGIKTVFATARSSSAVRLLPEGCFDAQITMNGAAARLADGSRIYGALLKREAAAPLLLACDARGIRVASQVDKKHYANFDVQKEWDWITDWSYADFSRPEADAEKIYALVRGPEDSDFIKNNLPQEAYYVESRDNFAMVMHKDATKSKALAALALHWGIGHEKIAAFGDDLNDIDMLRFAGYGVAVENALSETQAAASRRCGSNEADGPARWIEENILH